MDPAFGYCYQNSAQLVCHLTLANKNSNLSGVGSMSSNGAALLWGCAWRKMSNNGA